MYQRNSAASGHVVCQWYMGYIIGTDEPGGFKELLRLAWSTAMYVPCDIELFYADKSDDVTS